MIEIKGIYKLPAIKHAFFIVSSLDEFSDNLQSCQESKRRMEYFEHILQSRDHKPPKVTPQWTLKVVSEHDFVSVLKQYSPTGQVLPIHSSDNPEFLELLAINLLKNPDRVDPTLETTKVLSCVSDDDVIEVFI